MIRRMSLSFQSLFSLIILALFYSCANIVPPTGGPIDTTPPQLVNINPDDSLLQQRVNKIIMDFDKNMEVNDLASYFRISPLLPNLPEIIANQKRVTITIPDSLLLESTTYFLDFGSSITDNREKTAAENLTFTFSTGDYFDSLAIKGRIISAETGLGDSLATVILYPSPFTDSSILSEFPKYGTRTNENGYFEFKSLPIGPYRIFAIREDQVNYKWDVNSEGIGFIMENISANEPNDLENLVLLYTSPAPLDTLNLEEDNNASSSGIRSNNKQRASTSSAPYTVLVDTTLIKSQEINQALKIVITDTLFEINEDRIFLSYEREGTELEAIYKWERTKDTLNIITDWRMESPYTLRLMKGWATKEEQELNPGKYNFTTKGLKHYANLKLTFEDTLIHHRVIIIQDQDTLLHQEINEPIMDLTLLPPTPISVYIYKDINKNGLWDAGDYWSSTLPEVIHQVLANRPLRAGWDNEFSILQWEDPIKNIKKYYEDLVSREGGLKGKADSSEKDLEIQDKVD